MTISPELLAKVECPACRCPLEVWEDRSALACRSCLLLYPVRDGIPTLIIEEADPMELSEADR